MIVQIVIKITHNDAAIYHQIDQIIIQLEN